MSADTTSGPAGGSQQHSDNASAVRQSPPAIGLSLLMVTFLILCLFTFAAISLRSALNDRDTVARYEENTTAYYSACNEAEQQLQDLTRRAQDDPALQTDTALRVAIDDDRSLEVTLTWTGSSFEVTAWQTVSDTEWSADRQTLNLWIPD